MSRLETHFEGGTGASMMAPVDQETVRSVIHSPAGIMLETDGSITGGKTFLISKGINRPGAGSRSCLRSAGIIIVSSYVIWDIVPLPKDPLMSMLIGPDMFGIAGSNIWRGAVWFVGSRWYECSVKFLIQGMT